MYPRTRETRCRCLFPKINEMFLERSKAFCLNTEHPDVNTQYKKCVPLVIHRASSVLHFEKRSAGSVSKLQLSSGSPGCCRLQRHTYRPFKNLPGPGAS